MPQPIASPVTLDNAQSLSGTPKMAAQNVNFFYGSSQALFDVSLTFPERQVTALIGPSGCGKSTFLRCLNRMNDLIPGTRTEGLITLDKEDINAPNFDVVNLRRRVGMVFQTPNILPASIRQNMLLPLQLATAFPASEWRERMERSLTEVGLWHDVSSRLREPASILSGGNNNASALPVRWRSNRKSCSSTNPRHPSIPRQPTPSKTCSSSGRSAIPSFSSHMGCRKPKEWPRGLSCLGKDVCKVCFRPKNSPTKQR